MQYCYEVNLPVLIHEAYNEKVKQLKCLCVCVRACVSVCVCVRE